MKEIIVRIESQYFRNIEKELNLDHFLSNSSNLHKNVKLLLNSDYEEPDYLFVIDGLYRRITANINRDNIFFLTAEVFRHKTFFDTEYYNTFFSHFSEIFSCHAIHSRKDVNYCLPFAPWTIDAGYHDSINGFRPSKKYADLKNAESPKSKMISIICSNLRYEPEHNLRYLFCEELKTRFKDKISFYGAGTNHVETKREGIDPYKYHITLENHSYYNIVTEKLYDAYLGLSYPIYYGAPNITDYFPEGSLSQINISDIDRSFETIEKIIDEDPYYDLLPELKKCRDLCLNEYNWVKRIADIAISKQKTAQLKKRQLVEFGHEAKDSPINKAIRRGGRYISRIGSSVEVMGKRMQSL